MKKIASLVLLLIFVPAYAGTATVTGKITRILTHTPNWSSYSEQQKGMLLLYVEGLPSACGTTFPRVAIGSDHASYNTVLSLALSAQAQGSDVTIGYIDTCSVTTSAWDFGHLYLLTD